MRCHRRRHRPHRVDRHDDGFTLVELLVVIIVLGVLTAIAVPVFLGERQHSYTAGVQSDLHSVAVSEMSYLSTDGVTSYANATQLLVSGSPGQLTNGDTVAVYYSGSSGLCLLGSSVDRPGVYWVFDTTNGGLQPATTSQGATPAACPTGVGGVTSWTGPSYLTEASGTLSAH